MKREFIAKQIKKIKNLSHNMWNLKGLLKIVPFVISYSLFARSLEFWFVLPTLSNNNTCVWTWSWTSNLLHTKIQILLQMFFKNIKSGSNYGNAIVEGCNMKSVKECAKQNEAVKVPNWEFLTMSSSPWQYGLVVIIR